MNNDVQASQVPAEYLEDTEDVAAAKVKIKKNLMAIFSKQVKSKHVILSIL